LPCAAASSGDSGAHARVRSQWASSISQNAMAAKSGVNEIRDPTNAQTRFMRNSVASASAIHM
jgi:hypothetical protein